MTQLLKTRSLLSVSGEETEQFLENLITCSITNLEISQARFGALLTPQGKILFDFFIIKQADNYLIDIASNAAEDFLKRLTFYRLRAKVDLMALPEMQVVAYEETAPHEATITIQDPRHPQMPNRAYGTFSDIPTTGNYTVKRIALGIPESGEDFEYGEVFPHEVLMDMNEGVDFKKGCYVGQEVVSRMQHKSTIRKRIIKVSANTPLPPTGTPIMADAKPSGKIGSTHETQGLAMMRLDRGEKALSITADGIEITCKRPQWLNINWPVEV